MNLSHFGPSIGQVAKSRAGKPVLCPIDGHAWAARLFYSRGESSNVQEYRLVKIKGPFWVKILVVTGLSLLFSACGGIKTGQVAEHRAAASPTAAFPTVPSPAIPSPTPRPALTQTLAPTPTLTSFPTSPEFVTIDAAGSKCTDPTDTLDTQISPDGKWFTAACFRQYMPEFPPLHVVSIDHSREWKIYFRDYALPGSEHRGDIVIPYRWSQDGKYFYAATPTRLSGCCWIGGNWVLLVRLNLETGEQTALLNDSDYAKYMPATFTISADDRFLLFTPVSHQPYDVAVQDLSTSTTQTLSLRYPGEIDLTYAILSADHTKIVMPLFKQREFNDFRVASIVMLDLATGKQALLIPSLKPGNELFPIRFLDPTHVLLSSVKPDDPLNQPSAEFWSLDTQSGALQKAARP